jgi:hypothetical protein
MINSPPLRPDHLARARWSGAQMINFPPRGFDHLTDHLSSCGDTISDERPLLSDDHPHSLGLSLWIGIRSPGRKWPSAFGLRGRPRGTPTQVLFHEQSRSRGRGRGTRTVGREAASHNWGPCSSTGSPLTSPFPSAIMQSLGLRSGGSEHVLSQDQAAERRSMRSTDSHRLAQMRRRGGAGVRPGAMEFGSRRVSLHPNLPLLASLFHLCESVRICGRDPLLSGISRAAIGRRSKLDSH